VDFITQTTCITLNVEALALHLSRSSLLGCSFPAGKRWNPRDYFVHF
jgi:hypothetical protein